MIPSVPQSRNVLAYVHALRHHAEGNLLHRFSFGYPLHGPLSLQTCGAGRVQSCIASAIASSARFAVMHIPTTNPAMSIASATMPKISRCIISPPLVHTSCTAAHIHRLLPPHASSAQCLCGFHRGHVALRHGHTCTLVRSLFHLALNVVCACWVHQCSRYERLEAHAAQIIDRLDVQHCLAWGRRANATDDTDGLLTCRAWQ
jgi:hypothetical protein